MRKILKITLAAVMTLVIVVVALLVLVPVPSDMTARSKVVVAAVLMADARNVLHLHCIAHTLKPGMTNESFGFPEPYRPDPLVDYVSHIDISVVGPERALITATLGDIHTEFLPFWKTLDIPAGARLVMEFTCANGGLRYSPHASTTVPEKYLIDILNPQLRNPSGQAS